MVVRDYKGRDISDELIRGVRIDQRGIVEPDMRSEWVDSELRTDMIVNSGELRCVEGEKRGTGFS